MSDADGLKPPENSDQGDRWTVGRLLTWTTDYLKRRGSESPRLDAEVFAMDAEKPTDDGLMRLLIAARGQMQCADIRASAPMSRGGSA